MIDSTAIITVVPFNDKDSIELIIDNISQINDSKEFSNLLFNYLLADIFVQNNKAVPKFIKIEMNFIRGLKYSFNNCTFELIEKDSIFVDYMKFLLINVKAEDGAYFDLTVPVIKEFYTDYSYNDSLLKLLLMLYFSKDNDYVKTGFLVFYMNSDFPYNDLIINRQMLDSVLIYNGYKIESCTKNKVKNLYLDTYSIDTIKTIDNSIYYIRSNE